MPFNSVRTLSPSLTIYRPIELAGPRSPARHSIADACHSAPSHQPSSRCLRASTLSPWDAMYASRFHRGKAKREGGYASRKWMQYRPRGSSEAKQRERVVTVLQRINYYPRIGNKVSSLELDFAARQTDQPICLATCHSHVRGGIVGSPRVHQGHKDQSPR